MAEAATTIGGLFADTAARHSARPFLIIPANADRAYDRDGLVLTYTAAAARIATLVDAYRSAGYGLGSRVALLLENRPEYVLHKFAINSVGAAIVPINPDNRAYETAYVLEHSRPDLVIVVPEHSRQIEEALAVASHRPPVAVLTRDRADLPRATNARRAVTPVPSTPASILYTSGTTGRPKGCILSHEYEVESGRWYANRGGSIALREGEDRIYNPLPLYHVNAGVLSLFGAIASGNAQVQSDRFSPERWWREIRDTRATAVHYLGVIVPMLMKAPESPADRDHAVRFGAGAGVEPGLHAAFEERFGFPLVELWGMTEMVRILIDNHAPRAVGTRAFGRAVPGIEARVVDEADRDMPDAMPGELLIRYDAATPRKHFFAGYLDDDAATEAAWRGGWFHTGDTVWRGADGMLHFVDRKKNIIRRSGENIAAAEVEAVLLTHPDVKAAAVVAVKDEVREEEVFAAVVLKHPAEPAAIAEALHLHCSDRLAYFKTPGFIQIVDTLPTTGTQKIQKHALFAPGTDPRTLPGVVDLRTRKRRV